MSQSIIPVECFDLIVGRYAAGMDRELFGGFRSTVTTAEQGAAAVAFIQGSGG